MRGLFRFVAAAAGARRFAIARGLSRMGCGDQRDRVFSRGLAFFGLAARISARAPHVS